MRLYLHVSLSVMATFTHMVLVLGLKCSSGCAACWKDNDPNGVDTKFSCSFTGDCGSTCPPGYNGIHCANYSRCLCNVQFPCPIWGPCYCGDYVGVGYVECKTPCW